MTFADGVLTQSTLKMEGHPVLAVPSVVYLVYSAAVIHTPRPYLPSETRRLGENEWCTKYKNTHMVVMKDKFSMKNNNSRQDRSRVRVSCFSYKTSE
jgi:hypothetical protein